MYFLTIVLSFFFFSCSSSVKQNNIKPSVLKLSIFPGGVKKINLPIPSSSRESTLYCNGKKIVTHMEGDRIVAILAESYFSKRKSYRCYYSTDKKLKKKERTLVAKVRVKRKKYPREILKVKKKMVVLSPKNLKRAIKERKILDKVYANSTRRPFFDKGFKRPLKTKITSIYGTRRIFNNKKKSQHLGTDFRAKIGRPVLVSNTGKVVLARDLFFTGNTVIIDHGLGVFTMYGHLSKLKAKEGGRVSKGDLIGLAGNTGRVTGPHLHWGVKVHGHWVDGLALIKETR